MLPGMSQAGDGSHVSAAGVRGDRVLICTPLFFPGSLEFLPAEGHGATVYRSGTGVEMRKILPFRLTGRKYAI